MKHRIAALVATASLVGSMWASPVLAEEMSADTTPTKTAPTQTQRIEAQSKNAAQGESNELGEESVVNVDAKEPATVESQTPNVELAADQPVLVAQDDPAPEEQNTTQIHGQAHVQNKGWVDELVSGTNRITLGTTGESLRVEALKVWLAGMDGDVIGRAHVQDEGWRAWTTSGQEIGTTGLSRRVEAIRLKLEGAPEGYHLYYRVHVQDKGWLGWAHDGELAGTAGYALRLEAVELCLVKDGDSVPSDPGDAYIDAGLMGNAHVQNIGWQGDKRGNTLMLGTTGQGLRMEAFTLSLPSTDLDGAIRYESHVQYEGWQQDARTNGQVSGSTGQSRHVEAIRISLTGALGETYDLWYRVHVATVGWLDWTKDAVDAGSTGRSLPIEAIELCLQKKGEAAPGPTSRPSLNPGSDVSSISGDPVLDAYLRNIIDTSVGSGPDALRKAYDYTVGHYHFKHYEPTPVFDDDWKEWSVKAARELIERGEGNCYRFTGLFVWLARALGYEATPYIGWVKSGVSGFSIHSWAEIKTDGGVRAYDPDMQRFITQRSFFEMQYSTAPVYYYDSFQNELT